MEGYLLPEEIQDHCSKEIARDALNPLSRGELSQLLYLRVQAARSHRSSDLMRIVLANVVWAPGMTKAPTIDIVTLKPLGGKSTGAVARAKPKITFYIVDVITRTAGQYKSHRNPIQIPYKSYRSPLHIPFKSHRKPMQIPYRSHRNPI